MRAPRAGPPASQYPKQGVRLKTGGRVYRHKTLSMHTLLPAMVSPRYLSINLCVVQELVVDLPSRRLRAIATAGRAFQGNYDR